jgi:murein DD-endopeptidase MepM/ murein hydrolase activator NlpD
VHPGFLRALLGLVTVCLLSVPLLEWGILSLKDEIRELEGTKEALSSEIVRLEYVKKELVRIAEKEEDLKAYFGMSRFHSLKQAMGGAKGGPLELDLDATEVKKGLAANALVSGVPKAILREQFRTMHENFDTLGDLMALQSEAWEQTPSIVPVTLEEPRISSGFGWRKNPFTNKREFHAGIDIIGRTGETVIAPACGVVTKHGYDRWLGKYLVLQHTDAIKTIYGHLSKVSVKKGDRIQRGDPIGLIGNTGLSTSSHLHYSVVENGRVVDPMQYMLDLKG